MPFFYAELRVGAELLNLMRGFGCLMNLIVCTYDLQLHVQQREYTGTGSKWMVQQRYKRKEEVPAAAPTLSWLARSNYLDVFPIKADSRSAESVATKCRDNCILYIRRHPLDLVICLPGS